MRFGCVTLNFPLCFSSSIQYTRDATLTFISQQIDGSSRSKLVFCIYSNEKFQLFGDLNQKKKKKPNERETHRNLVCLEKTKTCSLHHFFVQLFSSLPTNENCWSILKFVYKQTKNLLSIKLMLCFVSVCVCRKYFPLEFVIYQ